MNYIVLDLEFNQPFAFQPGTKAEPDPLCPFEIIQIGAIKLNDRFEALERFTSYVQPQIYRRLHPYVERITGIKSSVLKDQPYFPEVYEKFLSYIGSRDEAVLCTWGGDDIRSLLRNIAYHKLDMEKLPNRSLNVQPLASVHLHQDAGKSIGLKNAVELMEIEINETFHDALGDAVYTGKILQMLHPDPSKIQTFSPAELLAPRPKKTKVNTRALLNHFSALLERDLTDEEAQLIKTAYKLGRNKAFDSIPKKKIADKREK